MINNSCSDRFLVNSCVEMKHHVSDCTLASTGQDVLYHVHPGDQEVFDAVSCEKMYHAPEGFVASDDKWTIWYFLNDSNCWG